MGRKRKTRIVNLNPYKTSQTRLNKKLARTVTANYHKELSLLNKDILSKEQHLLYQQASKFNTRKVNSSKYVTSTLSHILPKNFKKPKSINMLEIGAINLKLQSVYWFNVCSIDLISQHPLIYQHDIFTLPFTSEKYQVVVCFMVINYINDAKKRLELLKRCYLHLKHHGYLMISLPLRNVIQISSNYLIEIFKFLNFK